MPVFRNSYAGVYNPTQSYFDLMVGCLTHIEDAGKFTHANLAQSEAPGYGNGLGRDESQHHDRLIMLEGHPVLAVQVSYYQSVIPYGGFEILGHSITSLNEIQVKAGNVLSMLADTLRDQVKSENILPNERKLPPVTEARWLIVVRLQSAPEIRFNGSVFDESKIDAAFEFIVQRLIDARKLAAAADTASTKPADAPKA